MLTRLRRPAATLACASALLAAAAGACAPPAREPVATWEGEAARVELEYRGAALAVFATGDFNDWALAPFARQEPERRTLTLNLAPGEYAYLLGIEADGGWSLRPDPANPLRREDAGGRSLSLLRVGNGKTGDD
jgi:hypothetical protein